MMISRRQFLASTSGAAIFVAGSAALAHNIIKLPQKASRTKTLHFNWFDVKYNAWEERLKSTAGTADEILRKVIDNRKSNVYSLVNSYIREEVFEQFSSDICPVLKYEFGYTPRKYRSLRLMQFKCPQALSFREKLSNTISEIIDDAFEKSPMDMSSTYETELDLDKLDEFITEMKSQDWVGCEQKHPETGCSKNGRHNQLGLKNVS